MKRRIFPTVISYTLLIIFCVVFIAPILIVFYNSFKSRFYISDSPFELPDAETFAGLENYFEGIQKIGFFSAFGWSLLITVLSVIAIVLFTSMTAWYIARSKSQGRCKLNSGFCQQFRTTFIGAAFGRKTYSGNRSRIQERL